MLGAAEPDSLQAALAALYAAANTHGTDHRGFLDEVRRAWPELGVVPPAPQVPPPPPFPFPPTARNAPGDTVPGEPASAAEARPTAPAPDPKAPTAAPPRTRPPTTPTTAPRLPPGTGLAPPARPTPAPGSRPHPDGKGASIGRAAQVIIAVTSSGRPEAVAADGVARLPIEGVDSDGDGEQEHPDAE
ncbi:hypothetical protein [Embleya sp. NBC_00896]|uniref:hypothetical protein n=1 Tax=Embleya sp. NBC_00896 TaxID=2975961 RepID=UPI002F915891|nr:hypothetical protein OG928_34065 [Embleya sp. NBC_00896]